MFLTVRLVGWSNGCTNLSHEVLLQMPYAKQSEQRRPERVVLSLQIVGTHISSVMWFRDLIEKNNMVLSM